MNTKQCMFKCKHLFLQHLYCLLFNGAKYRYDHKVYLFNRKQPRHTPTTCIMYHNSMDGKECAWIFTKWFNDTLKGCHIGNVWIKRLISCDVTEGQVK